MSQPSKIPLPHYVTPEDLAAHFGMNARTVKDIAKAHRIGCKLGRGIVFFEDDVQALIAVRRLCPSKSTSAAKSGITGGQFPADDYEALRTLRTKQSRSASPQKKKVVRGEVISMERARR